MWRRGRGVCRGFSEQLCTEYPEIAIRLPKDPCALSHLPRAHPCSNHPAVDPARSASSARARTCCTRRWCCSRTTASAASACGRSPRRPASSRPPSTATSTAWRSSGLALIDESFRTLRQMIRPARAETNPDHVIRSSVEILVRHVHEHRPHFRFIARERFGGVARCGTRSAARSGCSRPSWPPTSRAFLTSTAGHRGPAAARRADRQRDGLDRRGDPRHAGRQPRGRGRDRAPGRTPAAPRRRGRAALANLVARGS